MHSSHSSIDHPKLQTSADIAIFPNKSELLENMYSLHRIMKRDVHTAWPRVNISEYFWSKGRRETWTTSSETKGTQEETGFVCPVLSPNFPIIHHTFCPQFSSVAQSCPTLCDPMNRSTPGLPVHQQLLEFTQTQVHRVSDAIQPSHPLSSPSPPAPNPSQHQSLFQ